MGRDDSSLEIQERKGKASVPWGGVEGAGGVGVAGGALSIGAACGLMLSALGAGRESLDFMPGGHSGLW